MTAFSNTFEFDAWQTNWCGRCIKDDIGFAPLGDHCPILTEVMINNTTPDQWSPGTNDLRDRYHCKEFEGLT